MVLSKFLLLKEKCHESVSFIFKSTQREYKDNNSSMKPKMEIDLKKTL